MLVSQSVRLIVSVSESESESKVLQYYSIIVNIVCRIDRIDGSPITFHNIRI